MLSGFTLGFQSIILNSYMWAIVASRVKMHERIGRGDQTHMLGDTPQGSAFRFLSKAPENLNPVPQLFKEIYSVHGIAFYAYEAVS